MDKSAVNKRTDSILFAWLLLTGLFGVLIGVPWSMAVLSDSSGVWRSAVLEFLFLLIPACAVGTWLCRKTGLCSGLREWVSGLPGGWSHVRRGLVPALMVGTILGGIAFFAQNSVQETAFIPELREPNTLEWFLRCLSAALTEEIFFRFGLMTLFIWIFRSVIRKPAFRTPSLWIGNLLAALVFAGAHLPQLTMENWILMIPVLMFSTGAGMVMGWLYMRYGLVSAIAAHFIADLIVYVIPRLVAVIV